MKLNHTASQYPSIRSRERGGVLVITIIFCTLLGVVLTAYLSVLHNQHKFTHRSAVWNDCIPLCEAGIEEALAHLNYSGTSSNFAINGWVLSGGAYRKERVVDGSIVRMAIDTAMPPNIRVEGFMRAPVQTNYLIRRILVGNKVNQRFPQAMLAKGNVILSGNNAKIDSFDSTSLLESTFGQYDPLKADDDATIATTSSTATFDVGNVSVYGQVATGPGGTVKTGPQGNVGDTLWNTNPLNDGKIQPGAFTDDVNVYIPDAVLPTGFSGVPPQQNVIINGTNYTYVLGNGDYFLNNLNLSSGQSVLITGNARIHVPGQTQLSGDAYIMIANSGTVEWYAGNSVSLAGRGVINSPGLAKDFSLIGLNTCTSISYSGLSRFIGTVYAPKATVSLSGNASATGAVVSNSISVSGGMSFHYDESLKGNPRHGRFLAASYQEL